MKEKPETVPAVKLAGELLAGFGIAIAMLAIPVLGGVVPFFPVFAISAVGFGAYANKVILAYIAKQKEAQAPQAVSAAAPKTPGRKKVADPKAAKARDAYLDSLTLDQLFDIDFPLEP